MQCTFPFLTVQSSNVENLSPQVLRQVAKEVAALAKTPLEGIKVYPNEEDITDIQASVEGPGKYLKQYLTSSNQDLDVL